MLKKKVLLGLLLAVFLLAGLTLPCAAQDVDANGAPSYLLNENVNESLAYDFHFCRVPYFVNVGTWVTGIHIFPMYGGEENLKISFWNEGVKYATTYLDIDEKTGWTGMIQGLLPAGVAFRSPSMVDFYSQHWYFTITQFIFTNSGFTHQTFLSYPHAMPFWPHWNPE